MQFLLNSLIVINLLLAPVHSKQHADKFFIQIDSSKLEVVSYKYMDIMAESPGAIGVGYVRGRHPKPVGELLYPEFWLKFFEDSVTSKEPFGFPFVRAEILLSDGKQILIDTYGRFIVLAKQVEELDSYAGPVRELRASQLEDLLRNSPFVNQ